MLQALDGKERSRRTVIEAPDEAGRLASVRALHVIGAPPVPKFQDISKLMTTLFGVPAAAVTLIDTDLRFVAGAGSWSCSSAGRAGSFCDWILVSEKPMMLVVEDALEDSRCAENGQQALCNPFIDSLTLPQTEAH